MIVLAIIATVAAVLWSLFVMGANGMSDSSAHQFEGGWTIALIWLAALALWFAWSVG